MRAPVQTIDGREVVAAVAVDEHGGLWLQYLHEGGWVAAFRLKVEGDHVVVSELRVYPDMPVDYEGSMKLGEWVGTHAANESWVPRGGLSSTVVQKIRFQMLDSIPDVVAWARQEPLLQHYAEELAEFGLRPEMRGRRRPGPQGPSDLDLARIARDYDKLIKRGVRNPVETMRRYQKYSYGVDRMRDLVHLARQRGLLSAAPKGKAGGHLTPFAETVLEQASGRKSK